MPFHSTITEHLAPGDAVKLAPALAAGLLAFLMGRVYRVKRARPTLGA